MSDTTTCWRCQRSTPVHALVAQGVIDQDDGVTDSNEPPGRSFIYDIPEAVMPPVLAGRLLALPLNYRPALSKTLGETTWVNLCIHCNALQGAYFLHSEPDGRFFGGPSGCGSGTEQQVATGNFAVSGASYSLE